MSASLGMENWGYIATAIVVSVALEGFLSGNGISAYIINKEELDSHDEAVANLCQLAIGVLFAAGTIVVTFIGLKWQNKPLNFLMVVVAIGTILVSLSSVPVALLARKMYFGYIGTIELAGVVVFNVISIGLSIFHTRIEYFGIAFLSKSFVVMILGFVFCRPRKLFGIRGFVNMVRFASKISIANLGAWFIEGVAPLIAGAVLGTRILGLYRIAYTLVNYPRVIIYVFGRVIYSLLSAEKDEVVRRNVLWQVFDGLNLIVIPVIFAIGALSPVWTRLIYSSSWEELSKVFLLASIHWAFYTLPCLPIQALFAARRIRMVVIYFSIYVVVYMGGLVALKCFNSAAMPLAGIIISPLCLLVLTTFRKVYPGGGFALLWKELVSLTLLSILVWYIGFNYRIIALVLWLSGFGVWLIFTKDTFSTVAQFIKDFEIFKWRFNSKEIAV